MRLKALAVGVALVAVSNMAAALSLESEEAKLSYSVGVTVAENMKQEFPEIQREALLAGLQDALQDVKPQLSVEEMEKLMMAAQQKRMEEQQKLMQEQMAIFEQQKEENLTKGAAFLAENATKEGVTQTESGLQYKVLEAGTGESPAATSVVTVDYEGRLLDNTVFDSSYERGEPAVFPLNKVIAGWTEGLQLMKPGAVYELYIPSELAYGERGAPSKIGPNEVLIFKVELKEIQQG